MQHPTVEYNPTTFLFRMKFNLFKIPTLKQSTIINSHTCIIMLNNKKKSNRFCGSVVEDQQFWNSYITFTQRYYSEIPSILIQWCIASLTIKRQPTLNSICHYNYSLQAIMAKLTISSTKKEIFSEKQNMTAQQYYEIPVCENKESLLSFLTCI